MIRSRFFKKIILTVFLAIIVSLITATFLSQEQADNIVYNTFWFGLLWLIIGLALIFCLFSLLKRKRYSFALIHLGFVLIIVAGFLSSLLGQEGFMEAKVGEAQDIFWIEDDLSQALGFSFLLRDFSVEFYPEEIKGMHFIKSFKTSVAIIENNKVTKAAVIKINKPFKYKGYWFYQYGYDPQLSDQTLIQVVKDPGLKFVYAGFLSLIAGILFSFKRIYSIY